MGRISQTDMAIAVMQEMHCEQDKLDYLATLPKGVAARVVGKCLDNGNSISYTERLRQQIVRTINAVDRFERNYWQPSFA